MRQHSGCYTVRETQVPGDESAFKWLSGHTMLGMEEGERTTPTPKGSAMACWASKRLDPKDSPLLRLVQKLLPFLFQGQPVPVLVGLCVSERIKCIRTEQTRMPAPDDWRKSLLPIESLESPLPPNLGLNQTRLAVRRVGRALLTDEAAHIQPLAPPQCQQGLQI